MIDTMQKRMSALNVGSPWRGSMVDVTEAGFLANERASVAYLYSGEFAGPMPGEGNSEWLVRTRRKGNR